MMYEDECQGRSSLEPSSTLIERLFDQYPKTAYCALFFVCFGIVQLLKALDAYVGK